MKQAELGGLRSISFTVANQVHVITKAEYFAQINAEFEIKAAELNEDRTLMSPLPLGDQLTLYGLTMQAFYGDNDTERPTIFELEKWLLWNAWTDQKGMTQYTAKVLFLKSVEGLW